MDKNKVGVLSSVSTLKEISWIPGNFREMKKFQEIQEYGKLYVNM